MRVFGRVFSVLFLAMASFLLAAPEVIVLRGGVRIDLKKPPVRQGNFVLLTRADGTLLSVAASEVDWAASAAARGAAAPPPPRVVAAPPETPAQAARASGHGPKARVKLTDADVAHPSEEAADSGEKEKKETRTGAARLEVADYSQEKVGANLVVSGSLRNLGGGPAVNSRMTVTAMDEKGERIASGEAGLSNALVDSGASVSFSVTIPVAERAVGSIRFAPRWIAPAPPAAAPTPVPAPAGAKPAGQNQNPGPTPTPYGRGTLYAPPAASAATTPPADDHRGYLPGMSSPENQPKPPK